jgi:hypothetical protein
MNPDDDTPIFRRLAAEQLFDLDLATPAPAVARVAPGDRTVEVAKQAADIPADIPPPDDYDAGLAGHLGSVTDFEWFSAHHRLMAEVPDLAPELDYIWDPSTPGRALVDPAERDMAHRPGRYDPGMDERFLGGGFHA